MMSSTVKTILAGSAADAPINRSLGYHIEKVRFNSHGADLVGNLYLPQGLDGPAPALPLLGPETFVKEQAPTQYAKRLANSGFVTLAFDPRYAGESGGEPRRWENPWHKAEDAIAAIDLLITRPEVDSERIAAMAICQGSSVMLCAAADDPRIKALVTVAGHYRDRDADLLWMGGEEGLHKRLARGQNAKAKFGASGEVDYVPAVDPERLDVGMPGRVVYDWYIPWANAGIWENRYAMMSDADVLGYESLSAASRLRTPYLMIHSDNCFLPSAARRHFEAVPARDKLLQWEGATAHFQYYDDTVVMDRTTGLANDWFRRHLDLPLPASAYIPAAGQAGPSE
jgi:fermentation-respiration switch protein FrsA (DUF1100 family)